MPDMNTGHTYSYCKHYLTKKESLDDNSAVCSNQLSWLVESNRNKKGGISPVLAESLKNYA